MTDTPNTPPPMNEHTPTPDDPMLTAYALGELEPGSEAYQAVQARIDAEPALREQAAEITALGERLKLSYAGAAGPGLGDDAMRDLARAADASIHERAGLSAPLPPAGDRSVLARLLPYIGVAACSGLVTAGVVIATRPEPPATTPVATVTTPDDADAPSSDADDPASQSDSPAPNQPAQTEAEPDPLDTRISIEKGSYSLNQLITLLRAETGENIAVNWSALEIVGIEPDALVTVTFRDVKARTLLDLVLQQVSAEAFDDDKAGFQVYDDDVIRISTKRDLKNQTELRIYQIDDLLVQRSALAQVRHELVERLGIEPDGQANGGGQGGLFGDGSGGPSGPVRRARTTTLGDLQQQPAGTGVTGIDKPQINIPRFADAPSGDLRANPEPTPEPKINKENLFGDDLNQTLDLASREELIDQVVSAVQTNIGDPDEWLDEESTIRELNGKLIVKTTPDNHRKLQKLLNQLGPGPKADDKPVNAEDDVDNIVAMMLKDIEDGLIDIRQREENREIQRHNRELERRWRERFASITDNPFKTVGHDPLSTFSVDVDTASYSYARSSLLDSNQLPTPDAVRIEEWINYFDYGYTAPAVDLTKLDSGRLTTAALERIEAEDGSFVPFATDVEVADCPWTEGNKLVRIGLKAMEVAVDQRPPAHLVFLLDVSGSMNSPNKLGLVKEGLPLLLNELGERDKVSIVVYAGASGLVLEAAGGDDKQAIREAINDLRSGGSTAGGEGIKLAYKIAQKHFVEGGINRVILCTDGDFNVGTTNTGELVELVKQKANPPADAEGKRQGVYLSVMGFGRGNLNDAMMEQITNAGNGNYAYIDRLTEAVKTMSEQASGTLVTVAKDVKVQVEFNPARAASYRLIGYENRVLNAEDFNDDTVDAGDIGAGHSVTALYEVVPVGRAPAEDGIDELRYQQPRDLADQARADELLTVKLRYKPVDAAAEAGTSRKIVKHVPAESVPFDQASEPTRFASSVAAMGMLLRGSPHSGDATAQWVRDTAGDAKTFDPTGLREQFTEMVDKAIQIRDKQKQNNGNGEELFE